MFIAFPMMCLGQNIVPIASEGNSIDLAINNVSMVDLKNVTLSVTDRPAWITITRSTDAIDVIKQKESRTASFQFTVDRNVKIGASGEIAIAITSENGEHWMKHIQVTTGAPAQYAVRQNYPNPFNPTTTIEYTLPQKSVVNLTVYDNLGRIVREVVKESQTEGAYAVPFDGSSLASGMYIYKLTAGSFTQTKRMMLLK